MSVSQARLLLKARQCPLKTVAQIEEDRVFVQPVRGLRFCDRLDCLAHEPREKFFDLLQGVVERLLMKPDGVILPFGSVLFVQLA